MRYTNSFVERNGIKQKKLFYNSLLSAVEFGSAPAASRWERRAKRCQSHQHIKQKRLFYNSLLSAVKFGSAPAASRWERRAKQAMLA